MEKMCIWASLISGDEEVEEKPERPRNRVIVMPEAVNNLLVGLPCAIGKRIEHKDSLFELNYVL